MADIVVYSGKKQYDSRPLNISMPYAYAIGIGYAAGHEKFTQLGYNSDVDSIREDLWEVGGIYVFPPAGGIQMAIVSSSASDGAAGIGARTVDIYYLDHLYREQSETLTLQGLTPVNTAATNILRVQDIHVMTVGSNGVSVGNLSLRDIAGVTTYGYIGANGNAARQAIFTVPAGKTLYMTEWTVGAGSSAGNRLGEFTLRATTTHDDELTAGVFHFKATAIVQDGSLTMPFCVPIKCVATTDVKISVVSDSTNVITTGYMCGWME